jgi:glycerol-3-phosphate dehydrogenase
VRYDLVIAGAGIYGAACAWFAARRGLSVLLADRGDLGGGASSNSMRIAHGGLRYLQSLDLARSLESIRERRRLLELAPRSVRPLACRLDLSRAGAAYRTAFRAGLGLNALLVGSLQRGSPRERRLRHLAYPRWHDALIEDSERVLLGLVHAACAANPGGVEVRSYAEVRGARDRDGEPLRVEIAGVGEVEARYLLECSGPARGEAVVLSMNLVVEGLSFAAGGEALALRHPDEGRNLFIVPWRGRCIVGTHDRAFAQAPGEPLSLSPGWVDELLRWLAPVHPELARLTRAQVRRVHAGLLPQEPGRAGEPAHHARIEWRGRRLRVQGVKWTTALGVAERAVALLARRLGAPDASPAEPAALEQADALRAELFAREPALSEPAWPGAALRRGDLLFAATQEWARGLDDVLLRRCGVAGAGHPGRAAVQACAALLQRAQGWSDAETREQIERFDADPRFCGNVPA